MLTRLFVPRRSVPSHCHPWSPDWQLNTDTSNTPPTRSSNPKKAPPKPHLFDTNQRTP